MTDRDDERWTPPIGPVDPEHPECAAVIAEVWTLLDGECTPESRDKLKHHLEECPACLRHYGVDFASANVLEDTSIREGIKEYSNWPTIPQLYVEGEFVGGCDIMMELHERGELADVLSQGAISAEGSGRAS